MKYANVLEEEIKNKVTQDFFQKFDCTKILGKIDFAVKAPAPLYPPEVGKTERVREAYFLWAEAKQKPCDVLEMLTQLVLTIGKARTFDEILPPPFLGCYDNEKIAFIPYYDIQDIFYQNDFNWKVAPSDRNTREFKQVYAQIEKIISPTPTLPQGEGVGSPPLAGVGEALIFDFEKDEKELKRFIRENFIIGKTETAKIRIDKTNFIHIYNKWLEAVKPTIQVDDWDMAKEDGIIDGDFYLADLLSRKNESLKEKMFVLLRSNYYEADKHKNKYGFFTSSKIEFSDNQKAHTQFWAKYERPPLEEYWEYITERRDLLVPQDVRERKGSFYTPGIWVELSQKYLADVFGKDWQDEYYVWDCAAGTGNLLAGLTNKYNIWASTLDKADVDVMKDRIQNGANLLESHVFQFDFLNDDFSKLPKELWEIINDPEERKRLIIYINPPYAEIAGNKIGVNLSKIHDKYHSQLAGANRELFAQFLIRIYNEIPNCKIAEFSKLKTLSGSHFKKFRNNFKAKLVKVFIIPAWTFDNVNGQFPIGFKIWDTEIKEIFKKNITDVFDEKGKKMGKKGLYSYEGFDYFSKWVNSFKVKSGFIIGWLEGVTRNDFQAQNGIIILNTKEQIAVPRGILIYEKNLIECCVCFAVRKVIPATWLNDRDQFLFPNKKWENDIEFQNDCLVYTIFTNNISAKNGVNHWIPFKETEINAQSEYESHTLISFLSGEKVANAYSDLFSDLEEKEKKQSGLNWQQGQKREFSKEAQAVFDAGKALWKYYHGQDMKFFEFKFGKEKYNVNASLYDIREYFQGRNEKGTMKNKSEDQKYNELIGNLRLALNILAKKIEPKVYEYGFLLK